MARLHAARFTWGTVLFALSCLVVPEVTWSDSAKEIDTAVDGALERFKEEVATADEFLAKAKGVLVLPDVIKAGFGFGGEYGEGALRIGGKSVEYYSLAAGSMGFQIGAQSRAIFLIFLEDDALKRFRESSGWKAGLDGSVAFSDSGAAGSIDTNSGRNPIVGFVLTNRGFMANATFEGAKLTKIVR